MAYDEQLADRIRDLVLDRPDIAERKMFGGIAWMAGGNMAVCVMREDLLVRVDPEEMDAVLAEPHTGTFGMAGRRPMRGFVRVDGEAIAEDADLGRWVDRGIAWAASLPPK
jgi:TfoX/Sxy family transcriptional regulator of competence genes